MSEGASKLASVVRFGVFTLDVNAGELHNNGQRVKLQEQPLCVLLMLLERPGKAVTREELQARLWPDGTFVDFEHSLNAAIKRLREALDDSADEPRFIETIPRRGYRFIAPVEGLDSATAPRRSRAGRYLAYAALGVILVAGTILGLNIAGLRDRLLGRPAPGAITSIAVLPLRNLSGDPGQDYFADGVSEGLITEMGQIRAIRVISFQSVKQFRASNMSLPEIADRLSVDAFLLGSVIRDGERVRVIVQLVHAQPEQQLWAHSYDRDVRDLLALQGELTRTIASEIRATVAPREQARLARTSSVNPQAYDFYLKGLFYWGQRTTQSMESAIENFQKAIALDPKYAPAYAYFAVANFRIGRYEQGEQAARQAVALDNQLAEAYVALSCVNQGDNSRNAGEHLQRAVELNPNSALAHHWLSIWLSDVGRHAEAIEELKRAQSLDPVSPIINARFAETYRLAGQRKKAFEQIELTLDLNPDFAMARFVLGNLYEEEEQFDRAIVEYERALNLGCFPTDCLGPLGYAYARTGNRAAALGMVKKLEGLEPGSGYAAYIATIYAGLGDNAQALHWLEICSENGGDVAGFFDRYKHKFATLRSDPQYRNRLRSLNITPN